MAIEAVGLTNAVLQFVDASGVPYAGGSVAFYIVGTNTLQSVFSDDALTVPLTNPVALNAAGRSSTSSVGVDTPVYFQQKTYDYSLFDLNSVKIYGPITFSGSQWPGQVQGQAVLSPAANANGYTNRFTTTLNKASSGTHALFAGTRFDIPTIGAGASTLTEAATVYIEGAPAAGTNEYALHVAGGSARFDGPVVFSGSPLIGSQFRLTLTTALPITTSDVLAATTVYATPYQGAAITLYTGSGWQILPSGEVSIALPASTSQMYDVFAFNSSGTLTLELTAWTNDTTRATALVLQDGILVKSGVLTHRYIGSVRTTSVSGQTEDSAVKRYLWNYYNRVTRPLQRFETTASWGYSTPTVRQANGSALNQVDLVIGVQEVMLDLGLTVVTFNTTTGNFGSAGIGENSTTTYLVGDAAQFVGSSNTEAHTLHARLVKYPSIGRNFYAWNEWAQGGAETWWGALASAGSNITNGLSGSIQG